MEKALDLINEDSNLEQATETYTHLLMKTDNLVLSMTITIFIEVDVKANRRGEKTRGKENISYLDSNFR